MHTHLLQKVPTEEKPSASGTSEVPMRPDSPACDGLSQGSNSKKAPFLQRGGAHTRMSWNVHIRHLSLVLSNLGKYAHYKLQMIFLFVSVSTIEKTNKKKCKKDFQFLLHNFNPSPPKKPT